MMRKNYLFILMVLLGLWSFSQTLVAYDSENVTSGSSPTGNASGVSSVGFTRSAQINQATPNNANHSSNGWDATSVSGAILGEEYIEWSVTAGPTFEATINELDIRLRRNANGPENFQILYSTDGFISTAINISGPQSLAANTTTNFNFSGLGIVTTGTITFRLFAWHDTTATAGLLRIVRNGGWSDLGVADVGARLIGTAVSTSPNSVESDIIRSTVFSEPENIDYTQYDAASGLLPVAPPDPNAAIKIGEFIIRDGGAGNDADSEPTILEALTFDIQNFEYLRALAIYSGGILMQEVTTINASTEFNALNAPTGIVVPDDGSEAIEVYATFEDNVQDNEQIQLTIASATASVSGSLFEFTDAGGAATSTLGDANRIEVTATGLLYLQNTSDVNQFEPMRPEVILVAVDGNVNFDEDFTLDVSVITSGSFDTEATTTVPAENGLAVFENLRFDQTGTGITISAFSTGFINAVSAPFEVKGPLFDLVIQDFDGSGPEWTYTNAIPFFDNGWGVDGYYGPIDISNAAPLDLTGFSGNILGENNLNDTANGNGTTGFARVNFATVDVSGLTDVVVSFDWQVVGYQQNRNDVRYRLFIDEVAQPTVLLFDGNDAPTEGSGTVFLDIPDGTSSVRLWVEQRNWLNTGYSGFDNFRVAAAFDGLIYRNNTWFPNAPDETTATDNVLINNGTYVVDSPIVVNELTVRPNAAIVVNPGASIETNGVFRNNGTVTLNSTSQLYSSILPSSYENNGETNYNRFVNVVGSSGSNGGNDLIALPLIPNAGQSFDEFIALGSPTTNADKLATNGTFYAFGPYDRVASSYVNFLVSGTDALESGVGYRAATTVGETLRFTGDVITANVTGIPVSKPTGGSQWNLLGNPYPSYMDPIAFVNTNSAVMDPTAVAIYGYNSGTGSPSGSGTLGNFTIVNNVTNNNVNIAPGQGFFIASEFTDGFTGTVDFNSSMRLTTGSDDFILGRSDQQENLNLRLKLESDENRVITDVYFHENGSLGLDPGYDAATYGSSLGPFALYTQLVQENEGRSIAVQTLSRNDLQSVRVPLGVNASQGQQLQIGIDYSNLPDDVEVFLEDTSTNTFTLLNTGDFVFTANANLSGTGRFYLNFGSNALSTSDPKIDNLEIFSIPGKKLLIRGYQGQDGQISVYDLNGRLVFSTTLAAGQSVQELDLSAYATGVYAVRLQDQTIVHTQKIILK
jgi:hypothetical protein